MKKFSFLFIIIFLLFLSCGGNNPETTPTDKPDPNKNEEKITIPDDLSSIATPLVKGGSFSDGVSFIYKGDNKIQGDIEDGAIDDDIVSIIRGKVLDNDGTPIKKVRITINNHKEFGFTYTRADGEFDIAVNGDNYYDVSYKKEGFITVQRKAKPKSNNFKVLNQIVMIPFSQKVTKIDLNKASDLSIARGDVIEDSDGKRESILMFQSQTKAKAVLSDGTEVELSNISVRATEFTVGENGLDRMPAELPRNTAYTYAIELSIDEAEEKGATTVKFDKPIFYYLDNFIGFPVGGIVPVGYYDREKGYWVSSENGRVIEIVSIDGNKASIDTTGDGVGDNTDINDDELVKLANLYEVGKTLWKVKIEHFTSYDLNWEVGCDDCDEPDEEKREKKPCDEDGSIINVHARTLGEALPIAGTGYSIFYNTSRVKGFKKNQSIRNMTSVTNNHQDFLYNERVLNIAGKRYSAKDENISWDGKDVYGRSIETPIVGELTYSNTYRGKYIIPEDIENTFNNTTINAFLDTGRNNTVKLSLNKKVILNTNYLKDKKLGAWSFSFHHNYYRYLDILYLGTGKTIENIKVNTSLVKFLDKETVLEDNMYQDDDILYSPIFSPDMKGVYYYDLALEAKYYDIKTRKTKKLGNVRAIGGGKLVLNKGTLYAGGDGYKISKITPTESIMNINYEDVIFNNYKCGEYNFWVDDFAISSDGEIYAIDTTKNILIKISQDGFVTELSGDCNNIDENSISSGDNGSIYEAKLNTPKRILIDENDNIYILEDNLIRKIDNRGVITTAFNLSSGEKYLTDIKVGDDFNDYIIDDSDLLKFVIDSDENFTFLYENRIVKVNKEFVVLDFYILDTNTKFDIQLANDQLIVLKNNSEEEKQATSFEVISGFSGIPSEDGSQLYYFDGQGKHLKTVDSLTGIELIKFAYNEEGFLVTITDQNDNITTIERDSDNYATKIIAPFGQVTILDIDKSTGYLNSLTLPMDRTYQMTYETGEKDGLLKTFTKPNGGTSSFTYDSLGLLVKDTNAEDGFKEIIQTGVEGNGKVEVKSAMGRVTTYETKISESDDSSKVWENSNATGCKTKTTFSDDYTTEILKPNGMRAIIKKIPSRFGEAVKDTSEVRAIFPSGREMMISTNKEIDQEDITDPLTIKSIKSTTTINQNRSVVRFYDNINKTLTTTSPMNRQEKSYFDDKNRIIKVERAGVADINYEYDDKGRLKKITQKDRFVEFNFNGSGYLETVEDNAGNVEEYIYDEAGRIVNTRTNNDVNSDFKVDYDENNNPVLITPAEEQEHSFEYDLVDRVKTYKSPKIGDESNVTSYNYNLDGQGVSTTTPDTKRIEYNYNPTTARLESINFASQNETKTINYTYDTEKDQLTSISLDDSTLSYEYDGGLLLSETSSTYNSKLEWIYDDDLRVEEIKLGDSLTSYGYNDDNQLTSAGDMSYTYDNNGFLSQSSLGSFNETYNYNDYGEVTSIINGKHDFSYTYDDNARIKTINNTEYFYDMQGRIEYVKVDGVETERYTYDNNGNRLTAIGGINATYDLQDRMETYGNNTYSYTPNGSLLTKSNTEGTTEYSYDAMGNLLRVELPNNRVITYQVDTRGRRIGKKVDGVFQYGFIYGDQLNPIAKVDESGSIIEQYIYGLKGNIPEYILKNNEKYKIISNHLGSPVMVVDMSDSSVVKEIKYDSFGNILLDSAPDFDLPFRFAGGIWDKDTKLIRFGVRDYDSQTGRWTSKEPLGFAGARNFYVYANNNGVNFLDLDGLKTIHFTPGKEDWISNYDNRKDIVVSDGKTSDLVLAVKSAINFINSIICRAIKEKREYGTSFSKLFYGGVKPDLQPSRIGTMNDVTFKPSINAILTAHVHIVDGMVYGSNDEAQSGTCYRAEGFSTGDILEARKANLPDVVGTLNGNVYLIIPAFNKLYFSEHDVIMNLGKQIDISKCVCPIQNGNKGEVCK